MSQITKITGTGIFLPDNDIDTDRIIPARFLKCITFDDLAGHAFEDDRTALKKEDKIHPFDEKKYRGASILITGSNFGSGSSREHAVRALIKSGIRAIISKGKYSEIFFGNAVANGLPCFIIKEDDWNELEDFVKQAFQEEIDIDLEKMEANIRDKTIGLSFQQPSAKESFITGQWDRLGVLLQAKEEIQKKIIQLRYALV